MGLRLPRGGRYIETPDAAVYGGESFACAVGLLAACGRLQGNAGASTCERKCEALSF
jgi:hypothetical protein